MAAIEIGIYVLSDDRLFCDGVLRILRDDPDLAMTLRGHGTAPPACAGSAPSFTVVDARMSGALEWCARLAGETHVLLAGAAEDDVWAEQALNAGARGIVTKTEPSEDLAKAIHVVVEGGIWARRRWLNASLQSFTSSRKRAEPRARLEALLSEREREVFRYAATGLGNKELADRLAISEATVKAHLSHIFQKLGVTGRAQLVALYHGVREPAAKPKVVHPAS